MLVLSREVGTSILVDTAAETAIVTVLGLHPHRRSISVHIERPAADEPSGASPTPVELGAGVRVQIGDDVQLSLVDLRDTKARVGITAPRTATVHRLEVYEGHSTGEPYRPGPWPGGRLCWNGRAAPRQAQPTVSQRAAARAAAGGRRWRITSRCCGPARVASASAVISCLVGASRCRPQSVVRYVVEGAGLMQTDVPASTPSQYTLTLRRYWLSVAATWCLLGAVALATSVRGLFGSVAFTVALTVLGIGLVSNFAVCYTANRWLSAFLCPRCARRFNNVQSDVFWPTKTCKHCDLHLR